MSNLSRLFALPLLGLTLAACGQQASSPPQVATTDKVTAQRLAPNCPVSGDPGNPAPAGDPDCPQPLPPHHIQSLNELGRLSPKGAYVAYVMRGGMGILGVEKGKYVPAQQALHDSGLPDAAVFAQSQPYSFINWSSNSCSTPKWITLITLDHWNQVFGRACELHDFGYNNVGPLSSDYESQDSLRNEVDAIFHSEMMAASRGTFFLTRPACNLAADGYYQAVRSRGAPFWTTHVSKFTWDQ
jgi:hypothetical protein